MRHRLRTILALALCAAPCLAGAQLAKYARLMKQAGIKAE